MLMEVASRYSVVAYICVPSRVDIDRPYQYGWPTYGRAFSRFLYVYQHVRVSTFNFQPQNEHEFEENARLSGIASKYEYDSDS
eukprot:scaffold503501_cov34-Prasinocladus_malaysianus.AAC.1